MRYCKRCGINPVPDTSSGVPCESCREALRNAVYETPERIKPKQQEFIDFMMDKFEMSRAEAGVMYTKLIEYRRG
jgi:hypothetical protein